MRDIQIYAGGVTSSIDIGRQGEHLASQVTFRLDGWVETSEGGYAQLLYTRQGDTAPYPCALVQQGGRVIWPVISLDTEQAGTGWCELRYMQGSALLKTRRFVVKVEPCISGGTPSEPCGMPGSWLEQLLEKETTGAENAGRAAAEKAYSDAEEALEGYLAAGSAARTGAQAAQSAAEAAQTAAEAAAESAAGDVSALLAGYVSDAQTARTAAQTAQTAAEEAAESAAGDVSALLAGYVSDAQSARTAAQTAQTAAESAQSGAEAAQTAAQTARTAAESARSGAETAQTAAQTARTAAESAQSGAQSAQAAAELAAAQAMAAVSAVAVSFTQESWTAPEEEGGYYTRAIPAAIHGKTDGDFLYQLYHLVDGRLVSNTWGVAGTDVYYDTGTGAIILRNRSAYAGRIVII